MARHTFLPYLIGRLGLTDAFADGDIGLAADILAASQDWPTLSALANAATYCAGTQWEWIAGLACQEKARRPAKQKRKRVPAWRKDAPTARQIEYLSGAGCTFTPATKGEASDIIRKLKSLESELSDACESSRLWEHAVQWDIDCLLGRF